jgi:hypothetical protein
VEADVSQPAPKYPGNIPSTGARSPVGPSIQSELSAAAIAKLRGTKGAVYVEFLIAFLPLFCFFLALVQFMVLVMANIMTKHAAELTARAAIVVIHDDPQYYGGAGVGQVTGKRKQDIQAAAEYLTKKRWGGTVNVKMKGSYTRDEMVEVTLEYDFPCQIPFGRWAACSGQAGSASDFTGPNSAWGEGQDIRKLTGTAALPNQGADYIY